MTESNLSWRLDAKDSGVIAAATGRVDETTVADFGDGLIHAVEQASAPPGRLVVDLSGIAYMSSRGLRALTLAQRKAAEHDVKILLAAPNPVMAEILAISRYDKVFPLFGTIDEALGS